MTQSIYIVGSKGIPAKYGGFETFVEKLTETPNNKAYGSNSFNYFLKPCPENSLSSLLLAEAERAQ